ncbi:MAG: bifunctional phosphopantothenoylcysteine decarboxylase/phosphopantothenate--cysteine ligase CoaBC [Actinomycetales bacterium]|nr:bifunctional phosphopantothenoylcysteine decarboxylase/phosphopantothenate--cysteine ligase CoaBC [Actinomycetales bacterium]
MPSATPEPTPRIVLGVAGGIAAYKAVEVLRRLRDAGYQVAPILTPDATRFVAPLTFTALASEPARVGLYDDPNLPIPHTKLGQSADLIVVAPATAHLIARFAAGLADDLLTATLMASASPVLLCPAMHTEMWEQPVVQENLATLRRRGVLVLEPERGHLAGGDEGAGRLADPATIVALAQRIVEGYRGPLTGRRVLVTAGGTREPIDPVRVITNRSSGRQGHAIAEVAARLGAAVTLVTTTVRPLALDVQRRIDVVPVVTAAELRDRVLARASESDVIVMAAAVADFTVAPAPNKLKKAAGPPKLSLVATPDILVELTGARRDGQVIVGFAAESTDVLANAQSKFERKGADLLVVNDVTTPGAGFESRTNEVVLLLRDHDPVTVSMRTKEDVALEVLTRVVALLPQGDQ